MSNGIFEIISKLTFPIFPVRVTRDAAGKYTKKPLYKWADPAERKPGAAWIAGFKGCWPIEANGIGYVPADQGLIVIDLDTGVDMDWCDEHLPLTRTHRTPSGSYHLLYTCAEALGNSSGSLPPCIDVRNANGLALWPGSWGYSVHDDTEPVPLPDAIRALLTVDDRPRGVAPAGLVENDENPRLLAAARRIIAAHMAKHGIGDDERGSRAYGLANLLGDLRDG